MKTKICYQLLTRYDNIVSVFTDEENNDVAVIEKTRNKLWFEMYHPKQERYLITYNFLTCPCLSGNYSFTTKEEAENEVRRVRPTAFLA